MAQSACEFLLKKDIASNCDEPIVPGFEQEGVIINRKDIDFATSAFNSTRKNVLETLALKALKKGYRIQCLGNHPFEGTNTAMVVGKYRNSFNNTVAFVVLDDGPDVRADIIDGLANGEFVVILENKFKGMEKTNKGDSAFQVYGWFQGLKASEMADGKYSEETDGGWAVTLQEQKAPKSGIYLWNTSYDATATAVKTLTNDPG